jgi:hypothetical protein
MPYARHARITLTNEGKMPIASMYYNIDYRSDTHPLPPHTLYFHAQYRQAQPNHKWTGEWYENSDPLVNYRRNPMGRTTTSGLTPLARDNSLASPMSVLQNQDLW